MVIAQPLLQYGSPADPIKLSVFREARRFTQEAVSKKLIDTNSEGYQYYMRRLIKGPAEHNWVRT